MAIITSTLADTEHDGSSNLWENSNDPWNVNHATTNVYFFGPSSNPICIYFNFYVAGLKQGSVLNDVRMTLKMINGPYNNGSTSRIYAAVENNLQTNPTSGSGRIVRGTRGKTPWDKLGRHSSSVTEYGNRCGPTHSHPSGLSGYGASVRDPYAILVKAFCTDQATPTATGRTLAANARQTTENLASALQPLVNDSGWSEAGQWVTFYIFSDDTTASSVFWGVGNLTGITYNNGMGASTATTAANNSAQASQYNASDSSTPATLVIDYQSSDISTSGIGAYSYGRNAGTPNQKVLARWRGQRFVAENDCLYPGDAGVGDVPFSNYSARWTYLLDPVRWGTTGDNGTGTPGSKVRANPWKAKKRVESQSIQLDDWSGFASNVTWDFRDYNPWAESWHTYSARVYISQTGLAYPNATGRNSWLRFSLGDTYCWSIETTNVVGFDDSVALRPVIVSPSGLTTATDPKLYSKYNEDDYYRIEIQASEFATPKLAVRIYDNDSTTPMHTISANPTSVTVNNVTVGDIGTYTLGFDMRVLDLEIWPSFDLNGEFAADAVGQPAPYVPKKWEFFESTNSGQKPLKEIGRVTAIGGDGSLTIDSGKLGLAQYTGRLEPPPYTKTRLSYGTGIFRIMDLYVPNGTPPVGGWPVMVWAHGGFFVGGDLNSGQPGLAEAIMSLGVAFASVDYTPSAATMSTYPSWDPTVSSGKYPSWILQYKQATNYLKSVAGTYNLDQNKFIASGSSAGGYIAFAAIASRGLTNDGGGRDLTLAGNTATFGMPNVADPQFYAGFFWSPPVSMNALMEFDPHQVNSNCWLIGTVPRMTGTTNAFLGRPLNTATPDATHTGVHEMIEANAANLPLHIAYCWAAHDWVVPTNAEGRLPDSVDQRKILLSSLDNASASLPSGFTFSDICIEDALHATVSLDDMDWGKMKRWLDETL